ncbi:MAG TPA: hypothetical protein VI389_12450 [Geobacteraceae bacterium]
MKLRVVIFEDDASLLLLLRHLLHRNNNFEVLGYSDPTMCPLYANPTCRCTREEACADILLTDNHMPNMTGLEFIHQQCLRGCKGIMKQKAVMSADLRPEDIALAEELGCRIFRKPFQAPELLNWVHACEADISLERKLVNMQS